MNQKNKKMFAWGGKMLTIILGSALYALALELFIVQSNLLSGGITGIGIIFNRLFGAPIGVMIIILNLPLFIWGFKDMGREFLVGSIVGTAATSLLIDLFALVMPDMPMLADDRLLAAGVGGALSGGGLGLIIAAGGSSGGTDILGIILNRRVETISLGRLILIADVLIVTAGVLLFKDILAALYTLVYMYITTVALDAVVYGAKQSLVSYIVTQKPQEVSAAIIERLDRGVTILDAKGAYTGNPQGVLMCAVAKRQLPRLKKVVKEADIGAFVIVSEAKEIMGNGFMGAI